MKDFSFQDLFFIASAITHYRSFLNNTFKDFVLLNSDAFVPEEKAAFDKLFCDYSHRIELADKILDNIRILLRES